MAIFDKLLKGILNAGKALSKEEGAISRSTARTAKTVISKEKNIVSNAASKVSGTANKINTKTNIFSKIGSENVFKQQAKMLSESKIIRTAGKTAVAGTVVGGGVYALGSLGSKGLSNLGYGIRDITGNKSDKDTQTDYMNYLKEVNELFGDKLNNLKDYLSFLDSNGLNDSPSSRDVFNEYLLGDKSADQTGSDGGNSLLYIAGAAAVVGAGYYIYKDSKKNKGKKK